MDPQAIEYALEDFERSDETQRAIWYQSVDENLRAYHYLLQQFKTIEDEEETTNQKRGD